MIFSFNKIKSLANLDNSITIEQVAEAINSIGFEVEEIKEFKHVSGVKYGKILSTKKNEQSDFLTICEIQFADKIRTIQTIAKNAKENKYVIAFIPGSKIGNITIESKVLKGVQSEGMMTGILEFGFDNSLFDKGDDSLIILDDANLENDPMEDLDLKDYLIDISILSNRYDANNYLIMAKEIGAYFDKKAIDFSQFEVEKFIDENNIFNKFNISKEDLKISLSQEVLLLKSGIKLQKNINDVVNFLLLMTGVPYQILDANKIQNISLEKFSGNINNINLQNGYVIKSNNQIIAIPLLKNLTSIDTNTKDFLFVNTLLNPSEFRKMNKEVKSQDLISRYAIKAQSIGLVYQSLSFINSIFGKINNITIQKCKIKKIEINNEYIDKIAGFDITKTEKFNQVINKLKLLGFDFNNNIFTIPIYRHDIENKNDIIEEIFRFYSYQTFPIIQPDVKSKKINEVDNLKDKLNANGLKEIKSYSLTSKEKNVFNPFNFKDDLSLESSISKERNVIRNSQLVTIQEIIEHNQKRKIEDIDIFDIGIINNDYKSLIIASSTKTLNQLKQILLNIFDLNFKFEKIKNNKQFNLFNSGYIKIDNKIIGWLGSPNLKIINTNCVFIEIILDWLPNKQFSLFKKYDSEPLKTRDITFTITEDNAIEKHLNKFLIPEVVVNHKLLDIFEKEGKKNITIRFFIDPNSIKIFEEIENNHNEK